MSAVAADRPRGAIRALRTLLHVAAGLPSFPRVWQCVVYQVAQSLCQAVPIGLLVLVIYQLRSGTVTAGLAWLYGVLALAALVGQCIFGRLSHTQAWIGGMEFSRELRMRVLDHLRRLSMSYHARQPADTAATFTADIFAIEIFTQCSCRSWRLWRCRSRSSSSCS